MKKLGIILAVLAAISVAGCASGGGRGGAVDGAPPFIVDLSTLTQFEIIQEDGSDRLGQSYGNLLRNPNPITRDWDGLILTFPDNFVDVTQYRRLTVTLKYFNADGEELAPRDGMGMVVFVYDLTGDWSGPAMGPGPNTPVKEMNVMGFSGMIHKDRGIRHTINRAPGGIFIQRAQDASVAYIELTSVVFHNGNFESGAEVSGEGPEGS